MVYIRGLQQGCSKEYIFIFFSLGAKLWIKCENIITFLYVIEHNVEIC